MQSKYHGIPKALIQSKEGNSLLGHQLGILNQFIDQINDIILVVGYEQDKFRNFISSLDLPVAKKVSFVVNEDFATTDNAYSIHLALISNMMENDFIFLDGDIVFTSSLFKLVADAETENTLVGRPCELTSEDAKVRVENGFVTGVGKHLPGEFAYGSMIRLGGQLLEFFRTTIEDEIWWQTWYSAPLTAILEDNPDSMELIQAPPDTSMDVDTPDDLDLAIEFMDKN